MAPAALSVDQIATYCSCTRCAVGSPFAFSKVMPGGVEAGGRHGVAVAHVEEVVDVAVEEGDREPPERLLHRRAVEVVDPVQRRLADVVVDGIGVGREEVGRAPHLVRVDEQLRRQLAQHLHLAVGLGLGPREPVAVHVEAVCVAPGVGLAPVGVLRRQHDDDRVVEDLLRRAVGARGELVEHPQRGVGAALLTTVHVAGDPEDRRHRADDLACLSLGRPGVAEPSEVAADPVEPGRGHPLLLPDDGIAQRAPLDRGGEDAVDDLRARGGDRGEIGVRLLRRDVAVAQVDADDVARGGDARVERRSRERVARRSARHRRSPRRSRRPCPGGRRRDQQRGCERQRSHPASQSDQVSGAPALHDDPHRADGKCWSSTEPPAAEVRQWIHMDGHNTRSRTGSGDVVDARSR